MFSATNSAMTRVNGMKYSSVAKKNAGAEAYLLWKLAPSTVTVTTAWAEPPWPSLIA